ncbi:hypothetical protein THIOKS12780002 [Thiocapsa sp. KS1]|nr:hypothetical protein THIOKS12780002 [Thiocapsa sp. KS1]
MGRHLHEGQTRVPNALLAMADAFATPWQATAALSTRDATPTARPTETSISHPNPILQRQGESESGGPVQHAGAIGSDNFDNTMWQKFDRAVTA